MDKINFKITLFLMSEKGFLVLRKLSETHRSLISLVVVGKDLAIKHDYSKEIEQLCLSCNIPVVNREGYKGGFIYGLAVSWRWMINDEHGKLIVIHDSLLPKYRGFNPLVSSLIAGDERIGATAIWANEDFDKGDIILQEFTDIDYPITIQKAIEVIGGIYESLSVRLCELLMQGNVSSTPQNEKEATYSLWRDEDDYRIDWSGQAKVIKRQIDAQGFPYKGASAKVSGELIRIIKAKVIEDVKIVNRDAGKVIFVESGCPVVVCGVGLIRIKEAFFEGSGESVLPLKRFRVRFS